MCKHATKKATWVNYGDVNPLEHGGIWIKKDTDTTNDTCYYVVKVDKLEVEEEAIWKAWQYGEAYIDISDNWLNWEDIKKSCDTPNDATDERKLIDAIYYYGIENFSGYNQRVEGARAIRKLINNNGIVIHRKEVC